jgi:hypothetical protein
MKRILLAFILLALPMAAQEQKQEQKKEERAENRPVQKLFVLKYADPSQIARLMQVFGGSLTPNSEMHALAVLANPETMKAIEEAIQRLDVPTAVPKDIELTFYLLVGGEAENPIAGAVPKDLDSVVAQLKNAFAFKSYHLLDTLTLRTRAGQRASTTSSGGAMQMSSVSYPVTTSINLNAATVGPDGTTIRIDGMRAVIQVPLMSGGGGINFKDLVLSTDLDIKEGQKVVVGRIGISHNQALFLVLTAHPVS